MGNIDSYRRTVQEAGVKPCLPSVLWALLAMMVRISKRSPGNSSEMSLGVPRVCYLIHLRFAINTSLPLRSAIAHQVLYKWWDYIGMILVEPTVKRCQTIVLGTIKIKLGKSNNSFGKRGWCKKTRMEEGKAPRPTTETKEE